MNSVHSFYWPPLLSFAAALAMIWWLLRGGLSAVALDHPNERSLHSRPIPRTGGLGLMFGVLLAWALMSPDLPPLLWGGVGLLLAVSFLDDVYGLSVAWRFLAHFVAASLVAVPALHGSLGLPVTVLAVVATAWIINLYNFMDGSDGLAGGMTLFGFGFYGLAAWLAGAEGFAVVNFSVAAAAAAFLIFNFHPARIFMGDAGSIPLGFLAAALGVLGWRQGLWPVWFPVLVFSPFIVDASVTLFKRLVRGEKVWQAHKQHYYQRLVQIGWGHRGTAFFEYALMAAAGLSAIWAAGEGTATQVWVLAGWGMLYLIAMFLFDRYWQSHCSGAGDARGK